MTVYFAQTRIDLTKVKIGWTGDLATRVRNMSVSVPGGINILATLDGGREAEDFLHDKFADNRLEGEWFEFAEPLRDFVRDIQNGKQGLIPFRDEAKYMTRETVEYSRDAMEAARQMATHILNKEFRGIGDTIDAAMFRVQQRHGLPSSLLHRLRYRSQKDLWAGEYLQIKATYEQIEALADERNSKIAGLAAAVAGPAKGAVK